MSHLELFAAISPHTLSCSAFPYDSELLIAISPKCFHVGHQFFMWNFLQRYHQNLCHIIHLCLNWNSLLSCQDNTLYFANWAPPLCYFPHLSRSGMLVVSGSKHIAHSHHQSMQISKICVYMTNDSGVRIHDLSFHVHNIGYGFSNISLRYTIIIASSYLKMNLHFIWNSFHCYLQNHISMFIIIIIHNFPRLSAEFALYICL